MHTNVLYFHPIKLKREWIIIIAETHVYNWSIFYTVVGKRRQDVTRWDAFINRIVQTALLLSLVSGHKE